jgi:hypothetical protein
MPLFFPLLVVNIGKHVDEDIEKIDEQKTHSIIELFSTIEREGREEKRERESESRERERRERDQVCVCVYVEVRMCK